MLVDGLEVDAHLVTGGGKQPLEGWEGRFLATGLVGGHGLLCHASFSGEFGLRHLCLVASEPEYAGCERWCRIELAHADRLHNLSYVYNCSPVYIR